MPSPAFIGHSSPRTPCNSMEPNASWSAAKSLHFQDLLSQVEFEYSVLLENVQAFSVPEVGSSRYSSAHAVMEVDIDTLRSNVETPRSTFKGYTTDLDAMRNDIRQLQEDIDLLGSPAAPERRRSDTSAMFQTGVANSLRVARGSGVSRGPSMYQGALHQVQQPGAMSIQFDDRLTPSFNLGNDYLTQSYPTDMTAELQTWDQTIGHTPSQLSSKPNEAELESSDLRQTGRETAAPSQFRAAPSGNETPRETKARTARVDLSQWTRGTQRNSSTGIGRAMQRPFPIWWNPDKDVLNQMMLRAAALDESPFPITQPSRTRCVLSPVAFPKLHWDLLALALILYDAWATPFQMLFTSDILELAWMKDVNLAITIFFAIDIVLNFNTGLIVKRGICYERGTIVKQYFYTWFWLDLVATFPYDRINIGTSFGGLVRFLKTIKFLKTIRLIRVIKALKHLQSNDSFYFQFLVGSKHLFYLCGFLFLLILNVHFFCCLLLAMSTEVGNADTFSKALHEYFDSFAAIFFAVLNGARLKHTNSTDLKLFEMVIAAEQFVIVCLFGAYAIFEALLLYGDAAKSRLMKNHVQRYMMRHGLPTRTQIEVLSTLEESRSAKALQKDFKSLTSSDLPEELQQKIAFELWGPNLMKLGLFERICQWDEDFCLGLSLLCFEDVLATNTVLFRENDLSLAAYYVLSGELKITCPLIDEEIPTFKEGTWVGEGALVNPGFRRGLRAVSLSLCSVMGVSAASFRSLLQESNLWHHWEDCIMREVCHGLCGRCGSFGDHFFDSCPDRHAQWLTKSLSIKKKKGARFQRFFFGRTFSGDAIDQAVDGTSIRELADFLSQSEALDLLPFLDALNIYSLSELEELDLHSLEDLLNKQNPPREPSKQEKSVLSAKSIQMYRDAKTKGMEEPASIEENHHLLFLSHYKVEAGTEAALMRSELQKIIDESEPTDIDNMKVPIFLDSEDLQNLSELEEHVKNSFNVVLLLTRGVLTRPWCLVELVTAMQNAIPVVLVKVVKPGVEFEFPTDSFYADLLAGRLVDDAGKQLLSNCKIDLAMVESTLREVFRNIAVVYSPHRPADVRRAELQQVLHSCKVHDQSWQQTVNSDDWMVHASGSIASATPVRKNRGSGRSPKMSPKGLPNSPWTQVRSAEIARRASSRLY